MKQTAVEWLYERLNRLIPTINPIYNIDKTEYFKQAKAMEKEQTVNFANGFYDDCVMEGGSLQQSAEDYYNETYNK